MKGKINATAKHNISGTIRNEMTGKSIIGQLVRVLNDHKAIISNEYGIFFSYTFQRELYFRDQLCRVTLIYKRDSSFHNLISNIYLDEFSKHLDEVVTA